MYRYINRKMFIIKMNYIHNHYFKKASCMKYLQKRNKLTDIENRSVVAKGEEGEGRKDWAFGISRCKLLYLGWINNKVLLSSTGNYIHYAVMSP